MVKGIEVAGEAGGGREATDRARKDEPDLVLMDLSMPDFDGVEAMRRTHEDRPGFPVVLPPAHADPGVEREAREAGASGFLAKGTALEDIVIVLNEASATASQKTLPRGQSCGRCSGNRMTSRMLDTSVSSINNRSMPSPSPPAGGIPCSSAVRKSS